jgi:hypothetical protein
LNYPECVARGLLWTRAACFASLHRRILKQL